MSDEQLLHGQHAVRAAVRYDPTRVLEAWLETRRRDQRMRRLRQHLETIGCPVHWVDRQALDRLTGGESHQGVAVRYRGQRPRNDDELEASLDALTRPAFLLVLDGVQDPHNLGACLRTADAAGIDAVIAPRDRAVGLTPTVHKVASGAAASVAFFQVTNLARTLRRLKARGIWLVGTAHEAPRSLYDVDLCGPLALVLGAEDTGLRRLTARACDALVNLPMTGRVASLNVSVAAGVVVYEGLRQRRQ